MFTIETSRTDLIEAVERARNIVRHPLTSDELLALVKMITITQAVIDNWDQAETALTTSD